MKTELRNTQTIHLSGKAYVILEQGDYEELAKRANACALPPLPSPDENGNYPAVAYGRASIARDVIKERLEAGLSQKELAKLAGVRLETLRRIETGKYTPSVVSLDKIDRALRTALRKTKNRRE